MNNDTIVRQGCTETNHHTRINWDVSNTTDTGTKVQTAHSVSAWTLTQSSQRSRLYAPLSQARAGPQDSTWDLLCWRAHWPDSDSSAVGREQSSIYSYTMIFNTQKKNKKNRSCIDACIYLKWLSETLDIQYWGELLLKVMHYNMCLSLKK